MSDLFTRSGAVIEGEYRYLLERTWDEDRPPVAFIMLNPSTADAHTDDPTIRRCVGFARRWGAGGIRVTNLFAYRATDPSVLKTAPDPAGEHCNDHIIIASSLALRVVVAWGRHGAYRQRGEEVLDLLSREAGYDCFCLGVNADGSPKHPLYVPNDAPLQMYRRGWAQSQKTIDAEIERLKRMVEALHFRLREEDEEAYLNHHETVLEQVAKMYHAELEFAPLPFEHLKRSCRIEAEEIVYRRVTERVDYALLGHHGEIPLPEWFREMREAIKGAFDGVDAEEYVHELRGKEV